jgi:hypothetical protein
MNKLLLLTLSLGILESAYATANKYQVYQVKKGDTISELLHSRLEGQLYKNGGLVDQSLITNRINQYKVKKLEIGSYIILPTKAEYVTDSTNTYLSANSKDGILSSRISHHQSIEFSAAFFNKNISLPEGGDISVTQNLRAKLKIVGTRKGAPSVSIAVENSNGVYIKDAPSGLVELKTNFELETNYSFLERNSFSSGALINVNEESNVESVNQEYSVRRDQYVWLGSQAHKTIYFKKFELNLTAQLKKNVYSISLTNSTELDLTRANLNARVNLSKDYYLSIFTALELGDRTSSSFGLGFTYKL